MIITALRKLLGYFSIPIPALDFLPSKCLPVSTSVDREHASERLVLRILRLWSTGRQQHRTVELGNVDVLNCYTWH